MLHQPLAHATNDPQVQKAITLSTLWLGGGSFLPLAKHSSTHDTLAITPQSSVFRTSLDPRRQTQLLVLPILPLPRSASHASNAHWPCENCRGMGRRDAVVRPPKHGDWAHIEVDYSSLVGSKGNQKAPFFGCSFFEANPYPQYGCGTSGLIPCPELKQTADHRQVSL